MSDSGLSFVSVYDMLGSCWILYELLKERTPEQSISHTTMPSAEQHIDFVNSRPYPRWYLIYLPDQCTCVGSIYMTGRNEIGVHIFAEHRRKGYGLAAVQKLQSMTKGPWLWNINPANTPSADLAQKLGGKLIQHTYRID